MDIVLLLNRRSTRRELLNRRLGEFGFEKAYEAKELSRRNKRA